MGLIWCQDAEPEEWTIEANRKDCIRYLKAQTGVNDSYTAILRGRPDLAKYQPHPADDSLMVTRFHPVRAALGFWDITVDYSTEVDDQRATNPLDRPAVITADDNPVEKVRFRDYKDRPILNTAGQLFDDPPATEASANTLFVVEKNIPTRFPPWLLQYRKAVNSDSVRIKGLTIPKGTLKIQKLTIGKDDNENDVDFCLLHMELEHDPDGWTQYIPNRGFYERKTKTVTDYTSGTKRTSKQYELKRIYVDGLPCTEPQFLDADGLQVDDPRGNLDRLLFLPFDMSPELPFSRLPLR
jgi:hypothetical protein